MILFQPCPHHFPNLWKLASPTMPELTPEHVRATRELYQFPDDNSEEAKLYFAPPSVLTEAYAKLRFQDAHGFLVEDGRLILIQRGVTVIESLNHLRFNEELKAGLQLSEECYQRARDFELPQETPRRGFPGGLAHGDMRRTLCIPCASQTWPQPK